MRSDGQNQNVEEDEIVGAQIKARTRTPGRPKKVIRNPYGRKGRPKANEDDEYLPPENADHNARDGDIEANLVEIIEPRNLKEALRSPQFTEWKSAIMEELDSLTSRKTWEVTELPRGRKCLGCRWVFKLKTNTEGKVTRYKARLVAQGFSQEKGVDYSET